MTKDFLLEIGAEEIPAGYISPAMTQLETEFIKFLDQNKVERKEIEVWATPRRLTLYAPGIGEKGQDQVTELLGPPKHVAFEEGGNLTAAALGFAKKQNVKPELLTVKKTERGEYLCFRLAQKGLRTDKLLKEFLPKMISSLYFPKTMRWERQDVRFARPIRWLLCLWGKEALRFKVGDVQSNNETFGHRILSQNKSIVLRNSSLYEKTLQKAYVIVDPGKRKKHILENMEKTAKKYGTVKADETLLNTVTFLTEYPTPILGKFDQKYLSLPQEVLITCMRHHQKYFSLITTKGTLLPFFIGISNGDPKAAKTIREGYERVLSARLEDAEFFYKTDIKTHLEENVEKLKGVVFQEKLGTLFAKTERIVKLSEYIASQLPFTNYNLADVRRTALLCKADLLTEMVKEFPELQGIIGKEYCKVYKEKEEVCQGICEHYLPLSVTGALPKTTCGAIVAIADKMDTIVSDFAIGLIPTSSEDPYALRRQAQGIVSILLSQEWHFSLFELLEKQMRILRESDVGIVNSAEVINNVWKFFRERIEYILSIEPYNLTYDEIAAVIAVGYSDVPAVLKRGQALHNLRKLPDFEPLTAGFKRANNILRQARDKKLLPEHVSLMEQYLKEEAELKLHAQTLALKNDLADVLRSGDYEQALRRLVELRPAIDEFFDKVMVMVEDKAVMNNRLLLLHEVTGLFLKIADISKLVVSG